MSTAGQLDAEIVIDSTHARVWRPAGSRLRDDALARAMARMERESRGVARWTHDHLIVAPEWTIALQSLAAAAYLHDEGARVELTLAPGRWVSHESLDCGAYFSADIWEARRERHEPGERRADLCTCLCGRTIGLGNLTVYRHQPISVR